MATVGSRREQKRDELRERIFRAAIMLFRQQGLTRTTIRHIADVADVAVGTFFNYFPCKEAVLAEFGRSQLTALAVVIEEPAFSALDVQAQVRRVLEQLVTTVEAEPELARGVVQAVLRNPAAVPEERARFVELGTIIARLLTAGQARGEVNAGANAGAAAQLIVAAYLTAVLDWAEGGLESPLLPCLTDQLAVLWGGLRP